MWIISKTIMGEDGIILTNPRGGSILVGGVGPDYYARLRVLTSICQEYDHVAIANMFKSILAEDKEKFILAIFKTNPRLFDSYCKLSKDVLDATIEEYSEDHESLTAVEQSDN